MAREGITLSGVLRNAWDTGDLCTLTKNNSTRASGAHVSVIGHITRADLERYLNETGAANGFGNRILWARVHRARILPSGGRLDEKFAALAVGQLAAAIGFAKEAREFKRDSAAESVWDPKMYRSLTAERFGLLGALTSRAAPQVMRLALIYALLSRSPVITLDHLEAAEAVWEYCFQSCQHIFGDSLGYSAADRILDELRERHHGLSRTDISGLFARNKSAREIRKAVEFLCHHGLAVWAMIDGPNGQAADRLHAVETKSTNPVESDSRANSYNSFPEANAMTPGQ